MSKVASIHGKPGMCRDDGSAITYFHQVYTNEYGGAGWYKERGIFNDEPAAERWCCENGYTVTNKSWG